jgi:AcrR family transcriptional regulator
MTVDKRALKPRKPPRTQAQRRAQTRRALLDAALLQMEAGQSFDSLSLRSVARAAGVVPGAFYRYFANMDALGLALIDESSRALREMLRSAREQGLPTRQIIRHSVEILVHSVRDNRQHFTFMFRSRSSGSPVLRYAIRSEIRLFASELATDLARFPVMHEWSTDELGMLSALLVNAMLATVESLLDALGEGGDAEAEIARVAEDQLRLVMLGVPQWRSNRGLAVAVNGAPQA